MKTVIKTHYFSYMLGSLPKGCRLCVNGEKLVLFITGLCNMNCFYCPLSEEKKDKDVVFANEWPVAAKPGLKGTGDFLTKTQLKTIIAEAKLCDSKGAGITGGEPLLKTKRTAAAIKGLKMAFGKKFHIHLYTFPNNVTYNRLRLLNSAGLDEIRFHLDLEDDSFWHKIALAKKFRWLVGVEIPVIPKLESQTKRLIDFLNKKIDFLNLNELEISDMNMDQFFKRGYIPKNRFSYGVKGSEEMALRLLQHCRKKNYSFNVHYCTCRLKDSVQMAKRIKRRAKNVMQKFDTLTRDGTIVHGAVYLKGLFPSFSYRKKIKDLNCRDRKKILEKLKKIKKELLKNICLSASELVVDEHKLRLVTGASLVKKFSEEIKSLSLVPAIVEEYPTYDGTEVEVNLL